MVRSAPYKVVYEGVVFRSSIYLIAVSEIFKDWWTGCPNANQRVTFLYSCKETKWTPVQSCALVEKKRKEIRKHEKVKENIRTEA